MHTFSQGPLSSFGLNMFSIDPDDITLSLMVRNNPKEVNVVIQQFKDKGIFGRLDAVNKALDNCDYTTLLPYIWSERDRKARLEWLRENAKLHTLLLFEQGLSEISVNPTIETVRKIVSPLFMAAEIRLRQDAECFVNPKEIDDKTLKISTTYVNALNRLLEKHKLQVDEVRDLRSPSVVSGITKKIIEKMKEFIETETPPSLNWLAAKSHGMVRDGENPFENVPQRYKMIPEEEMNKRRLRFAMATIEKNEKS